MMHAGKAIRAGLFSLIFAAAVIALASPTRRDEELVWQPNSFNLPLHVLSEEKLVETYRDMGYVKSCVSFQRLHTLLIDLLDRSDTPQFAYVSSEALRHAGLVAKATGNSYRLRHYQLVLAGGETIRGCKAESELYRRWFTLLHD